MSAVVILLVVKFSRFRIKDKSENTFIKYVYQEHNALDTTNLVKISQMTTLFGVLLRDNTKIRLPQECERRNYKPILTEK